MVERLRFALALLRDALAFAPYGAILLGIPLGILSPLLRRGSREIAKKAVQHGFWKAWGTVITESIGGGAILGAIFGAVTLYGSGLQRDQTTLNILSYGYLGAAISIGIAGGFLIWLGQKRVRQGEETQDGWMYLALGIFVVLIAFLEALCFFNTIAVPGNGN